MARLTFVPSRAVLTEAGAAARLALVAPRAVLAKHGTAACPALVASPAMLTEAGAAARLALVAPLAVRALLNDAPDWVRRRGGGRCCRNCWGCLRHGAKVAANCCEVGWVPFERCRDRLRAPLDAGPRLEIQVLQALRRT